MYAYFAIATFMNFIGKNEIALNMINNYTEAKVEVMLKTENIEKAHKITPLSAIQNIY